MDKKYDYTSQKSVYPAFFYLELLFILGYFSLSFLKKGGVICKFSTALKGGSKTQLFSFISTK